MEAFPLSIPGYEILKELGRGGMGIVFKARSLHHDRTVALKMILGGRGAHLLELVRFRIEAQAIGSLEHPNIVLIHEVGVHLGYPFFILEYAPHGSLAGRIRSLPMPCDWTAHVILKLALAMQHAHDRGIIHRDLKPANVLLMSEDVPKVTDFGLAKFTDMRPFSESWPPVSIHVPETFSQLTKMKRDFQRVRESTDHDTNTTFEDYVVRTEWIKRIGGDSLEDERRIEEIGQFLREAIRQSSLDLPQDIQGSERLTLSGAIMGTPQYMAPEQAWGGSQEVGPAADIYALGTIMYEMLTGQLPFTGDLFELIKRVRREPPVPPRRLRDSIPPALEAICMKCLEKSPDRRYETMGHLADDLQRFSDGLQVSALKELSSYLSAVAGSIRSDLGADTGTWASQNPTETIPSRGRSWWRFWE